MKDMRALLALSWITVAAGECTAVGHNCALDPTIDGSRTRRESIASTSTCSHVYCTTDERHPSVKVHHHNEEKYGDKIVCRPNLHVDTKCGCECYDEALGLDFLSGDAAELITVPPANPVTFDTSSFDGGGWSKILELNIPSKQNWDVKSDVPYGIRDNFLTSNDKMTHVAYLMVVDQEWVWASFEQSDIAKTGVPVDFTLDETVHSLNVYSNRQTGIQNGTLRRNGKVEFWNHCYNPLGGNNRVYDHDDSFVKEKLLQSTGQNVSREYCYGSMQVHHNQSLVFSFNGFSDSRYCDIEIGSDHGHDHPDATYSNNCDQSYRRFLYVFARTVQNHAQDWETLEHTGCGYDDVTDTCTDADEKAYVDNGNRMKATDDVMECKQICETAGGQCDGFSYDHHLGMCFFRKKSLCSTETNSRMSCYLKKKEAVVTTSPTVSPTQAPQVGITSYPTKAPTKVPTKSPTACHDFYNDAMPVPFDGFISCANSSETCADNEWMGENCKFTCNFCTPTSAPTLMPTTAPTKFPTTWPTKSAASCVPSQLTHITNFSKASQGCEIHYTNGTSTMSMLGDNVGTFQRCLYETDAIPIAQEAYSHIDVAFFAAEASSHTEYENIRVWLRFDNSPYEKILETAGEFSTDLCLQYPFWPECSKVGFYKSYDALEQPAGFAQTAQVKVELFNYGGGYALNDKKIALKELDVLGLCSTSDHTRDSEGHYIYDANKNKAIQLHAPSVKLIGTDWVNQTGTLIDEVRNIQSGVMYKVKMDSGVEAEIRGADLAFTYQTYSPTPAPWDP